MIEKSVYKFYQSKLYYYQISIDVLRQIAPLIARAVEKQQQESQSL
jgi:hypothetical protein